MYVLQRNTKHVFFSLWQRFLTASIIGCTFQSLFSSGTTSGLSVSAKWGHVLSVLNSTCHYAAHKPKPPLPVRVYLQKTDATHHNVHAKQFDLLWSYLQEYTALPSRPFPSGTSNTYSSFQQHSRKTRRQNIAQSSSMVCRH
uniref:Uncharacterized protein n=1 Tax=Ixodes ricinus TaxID=34613 RepID=A0A6B0UTS1_IXORI